MPSSKRQTQNMQSAICDWKNAIGKMQLEKYNPKEFNLQNAICKIQSAKYNLQNAICKMQSAKCNLQIAI